MSDYSLKRHFDGDCVRRICAIVGDRAGGLDVEDFCAAVERQIPDLELKDRVRVIARELYERLPGDYVEKLDIIVASLGPELREDQGMFTESWYLMPVAQLVEDYGGNHPEQSLAAIEQITRRHTGEFAIRPFLDRWHDLTMAHVKRWSTSESHNVRRLASEGIRSRLPWAGRFAPFIADPQPIVDVITVLIDDPSAYVRTSVANNLNDISKDHPEYAVETARQWLAISNSSRTRWIVEKGLRTLIKTGHPEALAVIGVQADPQVYVDRCSITPVNPRIGTSAEIAVVIRNDGDVDRDVIVDYQLHYRKADGLLKPTVFKLSRVDIAAGGQVELRKRHSFKEVKTRTLYPGEHALVVQASGNPGPTIEFRLEE